MSDDELIARFDAGTLPPGDFRHRDHVQLTWACLERYGRDATERRLLDGLRAFAVRAGKPGKFDGPLTLAWIARIADAAAGQPENTTFEQLVAAHPDLLDPRSVRPVARST